MREVVLSIPTLDAEQNLEIDVRINGRKRTITYRVEIVNWEGSDPTSEERVTVLKHAIKDYDHDWELIQIGAPTKENIPLMFRKKLSES
jgi:hypothetical protein